MKRALFNRTTFRATTWLVVLTALFAACQKADNLTPEEAAPEEDASRVSAEPPTIRTETVVSGYTIIWGMDFLPNGDLLFTEKAGRLFRFANGAATELTGLPGDLNARGQGGLLDVRVHPDYARNGWVYATYSGSPAGNPAAQLNLIRFKLSGNAITNLEYVFRTSATNTWFGHYGARIEFDRQRILYLSVGEGGAGSYGGANSPHQNAQNLNNEWGKIHRMTDAGRVPPGNPIFPGRTAATTMFSYGHRNPQGLALNPMTGAIWETEHGPRGGDEVNIIRGGRNYGWPLVSHGVNYDGSVISPSPTRPGIEAPVHTWSPSMGPSGLTFLTNPKFKSWRNNMMAGALAMSYLSRLTISNNRVTSEEKLLNNQSRVRDVLQGPDGNLYVALEGPGRIIRMIPQ